METISSRLTGFYKFGFLVIWAGMWAMATVGMLAQGNSQGWAMVGVLVAGVVFIWWLLGGLKRVRLEGRNLLISNYKLEIVVPVGDLAGVRQRWWMSPKLVTLELRNDTPFGKSILFMPRTTFRMFSEDEIVRRLRSLSSSSG